LVLGENYSIKPPLFEESNNQGVWIEPGTEVWAHRKKEITARVRDELWKQGSTEYQDVLKLIACTAEFDASLMCQDGLELEHPRTQTRSIPTIPKRSSTLNRLMQRVSTRDIGAEDIGEVDEWMTSQVTVITTRPQGSVAVSQETPTSLGMGVTLAAHSALEATARLTTVSQSTRDVGNMILPAILQENTQPFPFTASRGVDPGLSALELKVMDARALDSVTPQQPLVLTVEKELGANEVVLPIAFDGEFFQPLGRGEAKDGKTEIRIERLIHPLEQKTKSLGGSIRIFFQKVVAQKLGLDFPYPILAVVDHDAEEKPIYIGEAATVEARVADASRIILFLHGIIGDTQSIVPCVRQKIRELGEGKCLNDIYDLVMTFDYENLNTPIEELAQQLGQRLARVGLGPNHGKTLHIVAHSMGGLVSRSFIEQKGGHEVVQHLIMVGTPNGGSPWSTVQDWAFTALTLGLNGLAVSGFPIAAVGNLLGGVEAIDVNLDQMKPGSHFLTSLLTSPDPGVPYTILAGDTSLIKPTDDESSNRLQNLLKKLGKGAIEFPFLDQPNDIAASVYSIKKLPTERAQQPRIQDVACNHLVYFTHPEGLRALAESVIATGILADPQPPVQHERPAVVPESPHPSPSSDAYHNRAKTNDKPSPDIGSSGRQAPNAASNWFDKTHLVLIGIDAYNGDLPSLDKAVSDAKTIEEVINELKPTEKVEYYYSFGSSHPSHGNNTTKKPADHPYYEPTVSGFRKLLSFLKSHVQKNDRMILYFAGHGLALSPQPQKQEVDEESTSPSSNGLRVARLENKPNGYLLFQDAVRGAPKSYLKMDDLICSLNDLQCRHGLVILDCCFGGAVEWSLLREITRDIGVDYVTPSMVDRYIERNAWQILTSSSENQTTNESLPSLEYQLNTSNRGERKNSPFVLAFRKALIDREAEFKHKGEGTGFTHATMLKCYLESVVGSASDADNKRQIPCLFPFTMKHEQNSEFVFLLSGKKLEEVKSNLPEDPKIENEPNPYLGLVSYGLDDSKKFFGRDRSIEQLHKMIEQSKYPFTVVLGASGIGKSSLVCAGLISKMKLQVKKMRPGRKPGSELEKARKELEDRMSRTNESRSLLVIDQFEEIVTQCENGNEKKTFWDLLTTLVTNGQEEFIIVATLRSDYEYIVRQEFLSVMKDLSPRGSASTIWTAARYSLKPIQRKELEQVIQRSAAKASVYFSDTKNDFGDTVIDQLIASVDGMPGSLPLLSVALETMYNSFKERYVNSLIGGTAVKREITWEDYESLGSEGVPGSVRKKALAIYNQLDSKQQMIFRWMMMRMISPKGTQQAARKQVLLSEVDYPNEDYNTLCKEVLDRLDSERLIVFDEVDGQRCYELAHDILAIQWDDPKKGEEAATNQDSRLTPSFLDKFRLFSFIVSFFKPVLSFFNSNYNQQWSPMTFNQDDLILLHDLAAQAFRWKQPHSFSNSTKSDNADHHEQQQ
jgi:pimeloyl-ACP methyl ester carboxylesterase